MEEQTRPEEISPEDWLATPPGVRAFILSLLSLREQVNLLAARLNQTSQNSSQPPSSDPPSAPPKPAKTSRGKPRTQGAQAGHPPHERPLFPEDQVQHIVAVRPSCCPQCHEPLADSLRPVVLPQRQQVWELPEVEPVVTAYQLHTLCCPGCGDLVTAERPQNVPPGAFGPRVVALIALLHDRYRISNRELVSLLEMVWRLPISLGSVVGLQQVAAAARVAPQAEVEQAIERADRVNADETSWREGRRKPWLWVAVSGLATLFRIQYGRGKQQLASLLGEQFGGIVGSDRYCAYNGLDPKRRQRCWAHLLRNLCGRADAKGPGQEAAR
jgi:transposase